MSRVYQKVSSGSSRVRVSLCCFMNYSFFSCIAVFIQIQMWSPFILVQFTHMHLNKSSLQALSKQKMYGSSFAHHGKESLTLLQLLSLGRCYIDQLEADCTKLPYFKPGVIEQVVSPCPGLSLLFPIQQRRIIIVNCK